MGPPLILLTISRVALEALPPEVRRRVERHAAAMNATLVWVAAPDAGYIEAVLDATLNGLFATLSAQLRLPDELPYVLRLDDDEWASPPLLEWLRRRGYVMFLHWKFPRMHRWGTGRVWLKKDPLWPDQQTRLSRIDLAGGRGVIHAGSPFGGGAACPHAIVHDKFLKPQAAREAIAAGYDAVLPGAGTGGMAPFSVPERVWSAEEIASALESFPYGDPE